MATTRRESVGTFLIEFIGLVIGFGSIVFIYPLSDEAFGYAQFILSTSLLLVPFMGLGISNAVIKYYPETYDREGKENNLVLFSLLLTAITSITFVLLIELFSTPIIFILSRLDFNIELISQNKIVILVLGYVLVLVHALISYLSNFGKIATPHLLKELGIKIVLPLFVLAVYYSIIDLATIPKLLIAFYLLVLLALIIYGKYRNIIFLKFKKSILPFFKVKGLFPYLSFTSLTSLSSILAFRIDLIMIAPLLTLVENGMYAKIIIIAAVLEIPVRIFTKTTAPNISKLWFSKDKSQISTVYQATSNNSLLLSSLLWLLLVFNLDQIFAISANPDSFKSGLQIFLILSISKFVGVVSGLGTTIISFSPSYKFNLYFLLFLGTLNIFLNYFFILNFGIIGAAYATVISTVAFHLLKIVLLGLKYSIHPFSKSMLKTALIGAFVFGVLYFVPHLNNNYIDMIAQSFLIFAIFIPLSIYFKVSTDLNQLSTNYLRKVRSMIS